MAARPLLDSRPAVTELCITGESGDIKQASLRVYLHTSTGGAATEPRQRASRGGAAELVFLPGVAITCRGRAGPLHTSRARLLVDVDLYEAARRCFSRALRGPPDHNLRRCSTLGRPGSSRSYGAAQQHVLVPLSRRARLGPGPFRLLLAPFSGRRGRGIKTGERSFVKLKGRNVIEYFGPSEYNVDSFEWKVELLGDGRVRAGRRRPI
ncbi:hypothetical protein MRX96_030825 [Rhipicephalus microplus]